MDWEAFYNSFRKPDFVPGYEIQNRLGGGAFGDVYKARKQSIGKAYAIKFLKIEDEGQRDAVERELAQVRHFAAIDHPNLVTIEDMGVVMDVPYLIMGYAGEDTLARRLKNGPLERDAALLYFVQTCRGVLALHDRRLVHFDLKPSNVFLKGDAARVGDYGLSKLLTDGRMTLSFGRGTPQYMAPEMLRSRADRRADLYSLGVILYESLTGELPFKSEEEGGLILRERDDPPAFPDDFPARLRPAVEACLRLGPEDRFDGVGELLEALDQTARPGDSVALAWDGSGGHAGTTPFGSGVTGRGRAATGPDTAPAGASSGELGKTAAELARGAAAMAKGVWQGLTGSEEEERRLQTAEKARRGLRAAGSELRQAGAEISKAGRTLSSDVKSSFSKAREGLQKRRQKRAGSSGHAAAEAKARALVAGLGPPERGAGPLAPVAREDGAAAAGTVPVPPRVEGGLLGTVLSTLVVAMEVLVALVGNLLRGLVRLFRTLVDRLVRTSGGVVSRAVRLTLFLFLMGALGFGVMLVGMIFLEAIGEGR
jgi:tRNA A-37 threonylcarbamoyl transferase component Bud32